ncbi:hypothetical protein F7Q96_25190 [Cupriavidus gilardii]|nr:hypothetical protein F7Q96_25190 [Cupriavidus gilardii]
MRRTLLRSGWPGKRGAGHYLDYYRVVLRHFHIDVPESMFTEVQQDCEGNVGNRVVKHQADGSFTEQTF